MKPQFFAIKIDSSSESNSTVNYTASGDELQEFGERVFAG
jgi:hypothetical protein